MAYEELQGRINLAEQQVRMYRQAMQHLMPGPNKEDPHNQHTDTDIDTAPHFYGSLSAFASQVRGASQTRMREGGATDMVHPDTTASSDARPNITARMHIFGFLGGAVERITGGPAEEMAQSGTDKECQLLLEEIRELEGKRAAVSRERELVAKSRADLTSCREELLSRGIAEVARRSDLTEARENCKTRKTIYSEQLVRAMNMGALNDSFLIWQQGPFATINGFRLGRLDAHLVDWQEVNAGVGQAAIILVTVAMAMGVEFSKYLIAPCGSFSKIARSEDGRVLYSLHTDESFSLFPRRNFNLALKAFLHCLGEVGDYVQEHDPTLRLPYHIKEKEGTVGGLSVALVSSLEDWTRALKYMITDLKWVAAWASKYLPPS